MMISGMDWSNFLQNPNQIDFSAFKPPPLPQTNPSMYAPQIQGAVKATAENGVMPNIPTSMQAPSIDPAKAMSLAGRFMGGKQQAFQPSPMPQIPQVQAPTGTFSGLSPFAPKSNPGSLSMDEILRTIKAKRGA